MKGCLKIMKIVSMRRLTSILLMLLCFYASALAQDGKMSSAQRELVEAERAFAKYCVENGIAEAWMEFFTDDGIIFKPGPVNSKEWYRKRLPTPKPLAATLNWEPRYGDVSKAGDLGYNIGPWNYVNNSGKESAVHGYYMSIWRREPDGRWKVALDFGTGGGVEANADHVFGKPFSPARQYKIKMAAANNPATELQKLTELDREFGKSAQASGVLETYVAQLSDDVRVMRAGIAPGGKEAVSSYLQAGKNVTLTFTPVGGEAAKSGDLGYTYGSYELREDGQTKEQGYYAHIWKRDAKGRWRIAVSNIEKVGK